MRNRMLTSAVVLVAAAGLVAAGDATGSALPSAATRVAVTAGHTTAGIDAVLRPGGAIAGTVTSLVTHHGVRAVVSAYLDNKRVASAISSDAGHYLLGSLLASSIGYVVCAGGDESTTNGSPTGLLKHCSAPVSLAAGEQKANVDIAEPAAGAIAGRVVAPNGGGAVGVEVRARNLDTGRMFETGTRTLGRYRLAGLTPSDAGYRVCIDTADVTSGATGLAPKCIATSVLVPRGEIAHGVNVRLQRGAAISGLVVDRTTAAGIYYPLVEIFTSAGRFLEDAEGGATGHYVAKNLPNLATVRVCTFDAFQTDHWLRGECWTDVPWTDAPKLPAGTTGVSIRLGATHRGIDFELRRLQVGSISGHVTDRAGHPIKNARVFVYAPRYPRPVSDLFTNAKGVYHTSIRPSARGYRVCVLPDPDVATSTIPAPPTGWAPRCYGASWDGGRLPRAATRVFVTAAHLHRTGINIVVRTGGAISGTASFAGGGVPSESSGVFLFDNGDLIDLTQTDATDGTYAFRGLAASTGYVVCFDGQVTDQPGYRPQCYNGVPWHGLG